MRQRGQQAPAIFDFGFSIVGERNQKSTQQCFVHVFFPPSEFLTVAYCPSPATCCHHLITLFARANTSGGLVSPICFAGLRLITNSNFVACCTGRSAGLAPVKILST